MSLLEVNLYFLASLLVFLYLRLSFFQPPLGREDVTCEKRIYTWLVAERLTQRSVKWVSVCYNLVLGCLKLTPWFYHIFRSGY